MFPLVGIIANPASGKDIRRVSAHAVTVSNQQKVNVVGRVLLALAAMGVGRVEIMPDCFCIGERALHELSDHPRVQAIAALIDMPCENNDEDSLRATEHLRAKGVGCIVVLGGDGTCRVVAKASGETPLVAISTGTNNVVPSFVEGTVAGIAAAYVARQDAPRHLCLRHKRLLVYVDGQVVDQALVDVALVSSQFTGARAVWQAGALRQVFVTRASPASIGLSSLVGMLRLIPHDETVGAAATVGPGGVTVLAPIAPGTLTEVPVAEVTEMQPGERVPVLPVHPASLALDGEREIALQPGQRAEVALDLDGPWLVDVERALAAAVAEGAFVVPGVR